MEFLSAHGQSVARDVAGRHGVSVDAVVVLLRALAQGQGNQAQFNHPDLGGMGQWSRGGMIMVGDMFNNGLKARVDALCTELAGYLNDGDVFAPVPTQSQSQSQSQSGGSPAVSLFVSGMSSNGNWWPTDLGTPASVGSQNNLRYAFFPGPRRLAIDLGGSVTVYDTGDHQIGGFSQQQSGDQSLTFTSQHGLVRVADLPKTGAAKAETVPAAPEIISEPPAAAAQYSAPPAPPAPSASAIRDSEEDVFAKLEKLAALEQKGILSKSEFEAKKSELLARI